VSHTEFDARLQGARAAAVWPTVQGSTTYALLVASPVTGHVVLADLLSRVSGSASLELPGLAPHAVSVDPGREEGWVWCDSGYVVRVGVVIEGNRPVLVEQARAVVGQRGFCQWATLAQSVTFEDRLIAAGRTVISVPRSLNSSAYRQREDNTDRRLIDTRSHRVIIGPIGEGTIAAFTTELPGITEYARLSGLPPRVEAGVFDFDTGYLYVLDSGGSGAIIELLQDNTLRVAKTFTFPQVQGIVSAQILDGDLHVCCERRNRVLVWDLVDPEAPVLIEDTQYETGLYWERNPIRFIYSDNAPIRKFGSLTDLMDHGDYPIQEAGEVDYGGGVGFQWALHGEIGALTYTLPIVAATYQDTTSIISDVSPAGTSPPPYRFVGMLRPSPVNPTFTFTMPGLAGVAYSLRLRVRGRIEGKTYAQVAASALDEFGAAETSAGYDSRQTQPTLVRNIRWGTWTPAPGAIDNPFITVAAPGQDNYAKFFIAASDAPGTIHDAYTRVIDSILKIRLNGGQSIVLTLDWGGDSTSACPSKVVATGTNDTWVYPANIALMPPDDDPTHPLVVPWLPRFPADPTVFNNTRRPFVQLDVTHVQLAPGY
jgi:hypothetical protein